MEWREDTLVWRHKPKHFSSGEDWVTIETEPKTDLWQRTYYGIRNDNAPMLLHKTEEKRFSFTVKTEFDTKTRFDQCGVVIFLDTENWLKVSIEYMHDSLQQLASAVTTFGYSDWATIPIPSEQKQMYYRLSRRDSDFRIEYSLDGIEYHQMRVCHLQRANEEISIGVYACSPEQSSFCAAFSEISFGRLSWEKISDAEMHISETEKQST